MSKTVGVAVLIQQFNNGLIIYNEGAAVLKDVYIELELWAVTEVLAALGALSGGFAGGVSSASSGVGGALGGVEQQATSGLTVNQLLAARAAGQAASPGLSAVLSRRKQPIRRRSPPKSRRPKLSRPSSCG